MATFVKGAAIPNAREYGLYKKVGETFESVAFRTKGRDENIFIVDGYIDSQGRLQEGHAEACYTNFIHVDALENEPISGACFYVSPTSSVKAVNFYEDADETTFVGAMPYDDTMLGTHGVYDVKYCAEAFGAKYIRFSGLADEQNFVCFTNNIFFALDQYKDKLPKGETHHLVVQAIGEGGVDLDGDGVIYADSDYGGKADAQGNPTSEPLEYTPAIEATGAVLLDELTGKTLKGATYGSGGALFGVPTHIPRGTLISAIDIPAAAGSTYSNPSGSITVDAIKIYRINTSGVIEEELFSGTNIDSTANDNGTQVYHLEINKVLSSETNIGIWVNPADTTSAPSIAYCSGKSSFGPVYFGATKAVGETVTFNSTSFHPAFVIYK